MNCTCINTELTILPEKVEDEIVPIDSTTVEQDRFEYST